MYYDDENHSTYKFPILKYVLVKVKEGKGKNTFSRKMMRINT